MLSHDEQHQIDHELPIHEQRSGACIDALLIVQKSRGGYVSDDAIKDIADYLAMSASDVDSVATFYNQINRRPVGKNVIRICDSVSCWLLDYEGLLKEFKSELGIGLGETSKDGLFTLIPNQCLGCCDKAPALMINDDTLGPIPCNNGDFDLKPLLKKYYNGVS